MKQVWPCNRFRRVNVAIERLLENKPNDMEKGRGGGWGRGLQLLLTALHRAGIEKNRMQYTVNTQSPQSVAVTLLYVRRY